MIEFFKTVYHTIAVVPAKIRFELATNPWLMLIGLGLLIVVFVTIKIQRRRDRW